MAAEAETYGSDLEDDRSEASGFSDDEEQHDDEAAEQSDDRSDGCAEADRSGSGDNVRDSDSDGAAAVTATRDGAGGAVSPAEQEAAGPFKSSDKGAAIAKAFAKAARGPRDDTGASILSGSKSVQKRQREEQASEAVDRKAKLLRQEMRRRGHVKVTRRGEDPEIDVAEKALLRTARRGVVRLFNAVTKAQKQHAEAAVGGSRAKNKRLSKADFLAELRGKSGAAAEKPAGRTSVGVSTAEQAAAPDTPAWEALQDDDFSTLQNGLKMKDWDKREEASGAVEETMADLGSDDSYEDSD